MRNPSPTVLALIAVLSLAAPVPGQTPPDSRPSCHLPEPLPATFVEDFTVHFVLNGEAAGDRFGWIGRNAGDCDGDGVADLLISAPFKDIGGPNAGRVYVYSGADQRELYHHDGGPGDFPGIGTRGAGDVNGDGLQDFLITSADSGARGASSGRVFVISAPKLGVE